MLLDNLLAEDPRGRGGGQRGPHSRPHGPGGGGERATPAPPERGRAWSRFRIPRESGQHPSVHAQESHGSRPRSHRLPRPSHTCLLLLFFLRRRCSRVSPSVQILHQNSGRTLGCAAGPRVTYLPPIVCAQEPGRAPVSSSPWGVRGRTVFTARAAPRPPRWTRRGAPRIPGSSAPTSPRALASHG